MQNDMLIHRYYLNFGPTYCPKELWPVEFSGGEKKELWPMGKGQFISFLTAVLVLNFLFCRFHLASSLVHKNFV